ncbi:hypothetical protein ABIF63_005592 [Bradyrhizobium japonicum]|uniref:Uncharacterized protein n=1 Tax=Bradyrhizobium japonicum TaxID=375 RepID=A0ABV2RX25_BRAJP
MVDGHVALASTGIVVAGERCDTLEDRRLPGAILSDDDRDGGVEVELEIIRKDGQAKRISFAIANLRRVELDPLQIRRRQVDRAIASSAHARLPTHSDPSFDKNISGTQSPRKLHLRNRWKQIETNPPSATRVRIKKT